MTPTQKFSPAWWEALTAHEVGNEVEALVEKTLKLFNTRLVFAFHRLPDTKSAGAELCKKTLTRLWDSGIFFRLDAVFIAVIHDEVVWSVHRNDAFESIQTVWEAVSQPYTADFPVPFLGSISIGSTFGTQIELGEKPNRELTEATLDQLLSSQHK